MIPHSSDAAARRVKRQLLRDYPLDHPLSVFTAEQVLNTIKQSSNSVAAGLDVLTMLHLKHLGPWSYEFHTHLSNLSLQSADISLIWKRATLISIPKAGTS